MALVFCASAGGSHRGPFFCAAEYFGAAAFLKYLLTRTLRVLTIRSLLAWDSATRAEYSWQAFASPGTKTSPNISGDTCRSE
eukprot:9485689-Pyramimonas_sp.AAC.2